MIYFSDFGVAGPTTDVVFAVQDFDTGTSLGAQSFTTSTITGITPKAALLVAALHQASNDPGESAGASWSFGVIDASVGYVTRGATRDAQATTGGESREFSARALELSNNSLTEIKEAAGSLVSGGISLNFATNTAPSLRHFFVAFAGADVSAKVDRVNLGTGTSALDITSPGFQPDVVIVTSAGRGTSTSQPVRWGFGLVVNDGSATQRCIMGTEPVSALDGSPFLTIRNDAVIGMISSVDGSLTYKVPASAFDASGFSLTPSASSTSTIIDFIALKFTGRQVKLVDFDTPTTTGSHSITGAGFTPQFALAVLTNVETVNDHPGATTDNQGGFSLCAIGSDEQWCASWRIDSGAATTDTASQVSNVALMGASATDCDAIKATFSAWTTDGVTLSYSATQGTAKKGFILFVE
jgi:hypothetical protein